MSQRIGSIAVLLICLILLVRPAEIQASPSRGENVCPQAQTNHYGCSLVRNAEPAASPESPSTLMPGYHPADLKSHYVIDTTQGAR